MVALTPSPPPPRVDKILVGVDYSELGQLALDTAFRLALERDAQVVALAVADGFVPNRPQELSEEAQQQFLEDAQSTLDEHLSERISAFEQQGMKLNRKRVGAAVDVGDPAQCLLELADRMKADMIVVGTHGKKGIQRLLLGSVAASVLREAHCPVLVVRPKNHGD